MKYSTKLSDTVHVMVLIAINQEKSLTSASIAESVHTNPGFVRQLMLKLKKAELMTLSLIHISFKRRNEKMIAKNGDSLFRIDASATKRWSIA